ncbi:MAG: hypothetical protein ABH868_01470 [bacterium]
MRKFSVILFITFLIFVLSCASTAKSRLGVIHKSKDNAFSIDFPTQPNVNGTQKKLSKKEKYSITQYHSTDGKGLLFIRKDTALFQIVFSYPAGEKETFEKKYTDFT